MIVISDTGPIITLLKADCLYLLKEVFGEVIIPEAVYNELMDGEEYEEEKDIINDVSYLKIDMSDISEVTKEIQSDSSLDYGESAALALAYKLNPEYMLIEDSKARKYAESKNMNVIGSLAVLVLSYKNKLISKEDVYIATVKMKKSKRHISDSLYNKIYELIDLNFDDINEINKKKDKKDIHR